jgi:hypothetical protein
MYRQLISEENTFLWPSREDLKAESESKIIAAKIRPYKPNTT